MGKAKSQHARMAMITRPKNIDDENRQAVVPPQFTLRQALLAIGGMCAVLALYRATGLAMGTGILVVTGLVIGLIIAREWREWFAVGLIAVVLVVIVSLIARPIHRRRHPIHADHRRRAEVANQEKQTRQVAVKAPAWWVFSTSLRATNAAGLPL